MTVGTTPTNLGMALSEQAIRDVNFFNGRLVTSRDMARTQEAQHEADARLGQGIGAGIVNGLEIGIADAGQRQLTITAGLAISGAGQTLCLGAAQVLALVPSADAAATALAAGGFGPCGVLSGGGYVAGNGLYLLTLAPLTISEGKAPVLALQPGNVRCNTDAMVEAVQFRLLRVDAALLSGLGLDANPIGAAALSKWRSAVAYACFGYPGLQDAHPLIATAPAPALLDAMRKGNLSDCEVPLGLVYLTASQGIAFVDAWAVRRRVAGEPASQAWSAWFGPQLDAVGEAQLAQFQQQLAEIPGTSLAGLKASDWFSWLPAAGFLDASGARYLDGLVFLDTRKPARTVPLAPGDVRALLAQALRRDAVKLDIGSTRPRFRLYVVDGGPQFFVREAPNAPHAEEVWLDGDRARLPGINDVQSAIDALRGRTCGELSVWPGADAQALIDALQPGSDVHLCFEAGSYALDRPLSLKGLGNVIVHGSGAGSQLRCAAAESALVISGCKSASVADLSFAGGKIGTGTAGLNAGLLGALTVLDTPLVHIERVFANCLSSAALGAGCIVVRQTVAGTESAGTGKEIEILRLGKLEASAKGRSAALTHVCIADCELVVGAAQLGILCVNSDLTDIRYNRIRGLLSEQPPERGIVVAGSQATEVTIEHNSVTDAAQGIAIGLSKKDAPNSAPLVVQRATVAHNKVQIALGTRDLNRNRFGIFAGNVNSLELESNRVQTAVALTGQVAGGKTSLEAIRLNGVYGPCMLALKNHLSGVTIGINFIPQGAPALQAASGVQAPTTPGSVALKTAEIACLWLFQDNLVEGAGVAIQCSANAQALVTNRDNVSV